MLRRSTSISRYSYSPSAQERDQTRQDQSVEAQLSKAEANPPTVQAPVPYKGFVKKTAADSSPGGGSRAERGANGVANLAPPHEQAPAARAPAHGELDPARPRAEASGAPRKSVEVAGMESARVSSGAPPTAAASASASAPPTGNPGHGGRRHARRGSMSVPARFNHYEHKQSFVSNGSSEATSLVLAGEATTPMFAASIAAAAAAAAAKAASSGPPQPSGEFSTASSIAEVSRDLAAKAPAPDGFLPFDPVSPSSSLHAPTPSRRRRKTGESRHRGAGSPADGLGSGKRGTPSRKSSRSRRRHSSSRGSVIPRSESLLSSSQPPRRRATIPSAESPLSVGSPSVRFGSRRRSKHGRANPAVRGGLYQTPEGGGDDSGNEGFRSRSVRNRELEGRPFMKGPLRPGSGRVGGGSGGLVGLRNPGGRREPSGRALGGDEIDRLAEGGKGKEDDERRYVNPMKVSRRPPLVPLHVGWFLTLYLAVGVSVEKWSIFFFHSFVERTYFVTHHTSPSTDWCAFAGSLLGHIRRCERVFGESVAVDSSDQVQRVVRK